MRSKEEILSDIKRCMNRPGRLRGACCAGCDYELSHPDECKDLLYGELEECMKDVQ